MITTNIGKIFLKAYNEKYDKDYSARDFFDEILYPLVFDGTKYLQWVQNSPFVQMKGKQKVENLTKEERLKKLAEFHAKVEEGYTDASVALGYAASEEKEFATTSGQVTNMKLVISHEDIYLSWIGACLGLGVKGGFYILFTESSLLLDVFEGWKYYRCVVDTNEMLKGNQLVSAWNAQWLAHRYSKHYRSNKELANFDPFTTKDGEMGIEPISWTRLLISICQNFTRVQMMGYVYSLGKTNTTIGFIPFFLYQIRRPYEFYQKLFAMADEVEELWGTAFGFGRACQQGCIGVRAMEPRGLKDYIEGKKMPKYKNDRLQNVLFNTYLSWLIAMLNNEELWVKAQNFAEVLQQYSADESKGKTGKSRKVEEVMKASYKKAFMEALVEIVKEVKDTSAITEIASLVNKMPTDNVPYFLTLVKFHYAKINNTK
uniref:DUF935 family protein n=1 Tax=Prevotella sp. GTC17253 TaxID=3236793 RepID=A0AB33IP40_9BACT